MKRIAICLALLSTPVLLVGCSITGTWRTVSTEPADATGAPFQMVTFADDGQYSATHQYGQETKTSTGKYQWDGRKLTISTGQDGERVYVGRQDVFTGKLILSHESEGQKITATLEKQADLGQ